MDVNNIIKYVNLCKKANAVLYGIDNINRSKDKIYLIFVDNTAGNALKKSALFLGKKGISVHMVDDLEKILSTQNCKAVAITNQSLATKIESMI